MSEDNLVSVRLRRADSAAMAVRVSEASLPRRKAGARRFVVVAVRSADRAAIPEVPAALFNQI